MFSLNPLPSAALPAGVVVIGAATFWLAVAGLFATVVGVRIAIAAVHEVLLLVRESRRPQRHLRLVEPDPRGLIVGQTLVPGDSVLALLAATAVGRLLWELLRPSNRP
jgi:hypothetical protein